MPRKAQLLKVGDKFNKLEVVEIVKNKKNNTVYLCKCECGNRKEFYKSALTSKRVKSCGCSQFNHRDLIGKQINHIKVLSLHHKDQSRNLYYTYQCICGYIDTCCVQQIINKYSCGCIKKPQDFSEYLGKTFNNITIIEHLGKNKNGKNLFKYKCKCGNIKEIELARIGVTRSCGCNRKRDSKKYLNYEDIVHWWWERYQLQAKKRGLEFSITKEYAWNVFIEQGKKCALSGVDLTIEGNIKKNGTKEGNASMDRKDSSKGYIKGNLQWLEKRVNVAKMDMSDQEFIEMCQRVVKHNGCG